MAQRKTKQKKEVAPREKFNFVQVTEDGDVDEEEAALFWAMDVEQPKGWEEEDEIDYSKMVDRSETSMPSLFQYSQSTQFQVKCLGTVKNLQGPVLAGDDGQSEVLETIDTAQRQGRLPWITQEHDKCVLNVSRYGIKSTDEMRKRVITRHPLHKIGSVIFYEDTYGKPMVAMLVGQTSLEHYDIAVYHCQDEEQAKDLCMTLAQAFEAVFNKMQLEQQN